MTRIAIEITQEDIDKARKAMGDDPAPPSSRNCAFVRALMRHFGKPMWSGNEDFGIDRGIGSAATVALGKLELDASDFVSRFDLNYPEKPALPQTVHVNTEE